MKKALIASTALVLTAGIAAADVTISGYGRTAVDYQEDRGDGQEDTQISSRVRLNIHGTTSTDQGVDFGARYRIQWNQGDAGVDNVAPGQIYVTSNGLTVAVGNVGTAFDNAGLIYESEIGLISRSYGNAQGDFYAYSSTGYGDDNGDRLGVAVEYSVDALTARFSYVDPDQNTTDSTNEELGLSVDYQWNDIALSAAAVKNAAGTADADKYFVGAYYTMPGTDNGIGLNYIDEDSDADNYGTTIVLYGDYVVAPMTTVSAYVANNDADGNETDTAFGIGARYDLGGAYLAGSLERNYEENLRGDFGVRFDF
ncbi:porin [Paracoccus sp. 1_MG-2023]|uniref:porin n=1 Tax=unclassified Paracoccus (in: a-proteobacteria) TaxID=2688777 RepID=UPI001C089347|nr:MULTISPECIES: porin [unclassified Paracoccus (in: a-proteobacteria)]MBU2957376.1 porin [Paracoccus sp. C2R09]MDO6670138.1 porin [Paracoccus sp. 1_MG-2023]